MCIRDSLVTDITEFRLPDDPRKVYLSPAVDLFDGDVAAFSVGTSPSKALVAEMLAGAVAAAGGGFTLHSDRGWHYRTPDSVSYTHLDVYKRQHLEDGILNMRTPSMDFKAGWCDFCTTEPDGPQCLKVCPTQAIVLPTGAKMCIRDRYWMPPLP